MKLSAREESLQIPNYSLTGDLLSYMRCARQYRYQNGSALPPARPVQLWFGEFVHGVMELAFTLWRANPKFQTFPWPETTIEWKDRDKNLGLADNDIGEIGRRVENTLAVQGKSARNAAARLSAYKRVSQAINLVGPHLFPLVEYAEEPLTGSRTLPASPQTLRAHRYGLTGVVDVLTAIKMSTVPASNLIRAAIESELKAQGIQAPNEYEVIVDYKGAARPQVGEPYWRQHEWQIQTYAWLRQRKPEAKKVVAGILLYINELLPNEDDMNRISKALHAGTLANAPAKGTPDFNTLNLWKPGVSSANLSEGFRIQRALRVVPVTDASVAQSLSAFDNVVLDIETSSSGSRTATMRPPATRATSSRRVPTHSIRQAVISRPRRWPLEPRRARCALTQSRTQHFAKCVNCALAAISFGAHCTCRRAPPLLEKMRTQICARPAFSRPRSFSDCCRQRTDGVLDHGRASVWRRVAGAPRR